MTNVAAEVLDREYLELRSRLLDFAASLDRIDRASGSVAGDPRFEKIMAGLQLLANGETSRAERIQLLFSQDYAREWRSEYAV